MTALHVKELRVRLGWTQSALAERIGVTVAAVRAWERGRRKPSGPVVLLLQDLAATAPEAPPRDETPSDVLGASPKENVIPSGAREVALRVGLDVLTVELDRARAERDAAQRDAVTVRAECERMREGMRALVWGDHPESCTCVPCETIRDVRRFFRETYCPAEGQGTERLKAGGKGADLLPRLELD